MPCSHHTLAKAFHAWAANANAKGVQRELLQRAAATIVNSRLARALRHWRDWASESRFLQGKAHQVVQLMMRRQQVGCLAMK